MKDVFLECVIAPSFEEDALALLEAKKNIRLMVTGSWAQAGEPDHSWRGMDFKHVVNGLLLQERDQGSVTAEELKVVSKRQPTAEDLEEMLFAWRVCKHVKSNAILLSKNKVTVGVGPGQTNRVGAAEIALKGAKEAARGAVAASDAFFPFRDSIDTLAKAGIKAVIQPGGSVRDEEVVAAVDEHGMSMVFTGIRHFKH